MTRITLFLIAIILLLGCRYDHDSKPAVVVPADSCMEGFAPYGEEVRRQIDDEIQYYLERHDYRDEGYDSVRYFLEQTDTMFKACMSQGPIPYYNIGRWHGIKRWGRGVCHDGRGWIVTGVWLADTISRGICFGKDGIYAGQLGSSMEACGLGSFWGCDGSYYTGQWNHGQREGFGLSVAPDLIRVGIWRWGMFRGERFLYHRDRVYGIDISRYQHERGRHRFTIDWNRLRITHLGRRIGQERISGNVNYPVSFVYMKSTQGTDIVSRYYESDYEHARRKKLPTGAYHFFSTHINGHDQARHYLAHTRFNTGDLPPMLDIEPSDQQIELMGGANRLFDEARAWLLDVERATGCKPIIYCNQNFAKTYLPFAPDLQQNYRFWIARYGEYKPDLHLDLWQSSCDGRVEGIHTHVDLNVFNGNREQWETFLREVTVK